MRILIASVTYAPFSNGQAIFTSNLAEQLATNHHEVLAIVPSDQGQTYRINRNGVDTQYLWTIDLSFLYPGSVFTPFPAEEVKRVFEWFRPDIAHIQDHYPLCYHTYKIARQLGVKVVGTNHFMPENIAPVFPWLSKFKSNFDWALWKWMLGLYNKLDMVTAQSKTAVDILRNKGIQVETKPITCGVNLDRFKPDPSINRNLWRSKYGLSMNKTTFLFVGRVGGEKRLDVIIRALHRLKRKDIQLVIAGIGAFVSKLNALVNELNLQDSVHFTGFIPNDHLPPLLNSVDIFTMPSEAELLSIASLEAMATAKPLLLADAQALPELVTNGENGYLFRAGDVEDAANYMALLADHPERWEDMGSASLEKAKMHSLEMMRQGFEEVYKTVLSNKISK
jgi:glycosyltransferase involved in cell wall biosynthesis